MNPMKLRLSDDMKAKTKGFFRSASNRVRAAGPPVLRWLLGHKAVVVIVVLVIYILYPKNSTPEIRGTSTSDSSVAATNPAPATTQSTTQRATRPTTEPVTAQFAGDIPLYAPGAEGADPQWSLPVELSGAEIQAFIKRVDNLANEFNAANELESRYEKTLSILTEDKTFILFWIRALGPGFRDKNLPHDWYQIVKDRPTGLVAQADATVEFMFKKMIVDAVLTRFRSIQTRLIGGKLLIGDRLFIKALQTYEDDRLTRFKKLTPLAESIVERSATEFRKELEQQRKNSGGGND